MLSQSLQIKGMEIRMGGKVKPCVLADVRIVFERDPSRGRWRLGEEFSDARVGERVTGRENLVGS